MEGMWNPRPKEADEPSQLGTGTSIHTEINIGSLASSVLDPQIGSSYCETHVVRIQLQKSAR
jgi:hypothetical protein